MIQQSHSWTHPQISKVKAFSRVRLLPGSSLHGILQARVLEWDAIAFSRRSFQSRDQTQVSHIPGRRFNF